MSRAWQLVKDFYRKAADDNVTGLSGMVAYNLLAAVIPLAFLALFIAGRVLDSPNIEASVLADLRRLFPDAEEATLTKVLSDLRNNSTSLGIAALIAGVWIGSSFWGALDTAFCRIYHMRCRGWWEQKRFALVMLGLVLLFLMATVAIPTVQSILVRGATSLPFGLDSVRSALFVVTLGVGVVVVFGALCVIFWAVPNERMPWLAIWPGAAGATAAITVIDYAFPFYLGHISSIERVGTTLVFLVIVLIWFYAHALIILCAATVNAMRYELHDTGALAIRNGPCPDRPCPEGAQAGPHSGL